MNYVPGGELFSHLEQDWRLLEHEAKMYIAMLVDAIGYIHTNGHLYWDLKPRNILLGSDGYLVLADFGLAAQVTEDEMRYTFCGTPEYLAPEIVNRFCHNHCVDWWAIGILLYEMIVGFPPFYHDNRAKMYEYISEAEILFPDGEYGISMSPECQDFISQLLVKDPAHRLGVNGVQDVKAHDWFRDMDFEALLNKQLEPPLYPDMTQPI